MIDRIRRIGFYGYTPFKGAQKGRHSKQYILKQKGKGETMKEISVGIIITILLFAEFSSIFLVQHASADPGFSGWLTKVIKKLSNKVELLRSAPKWFQIGSVVVITLVAFVSLNYGGVLLALLKEIAEGAGWINAVQKVIKGPSGKIVTFIIKLLSETEIEVPIESMSEEGNWTFEFMGTPYESDVGGVLMPVDKFGLLAPYIGLASTILAATVATAVYVKRVKRKKEKQ